MSPRDVRHPPPRAASGKTGAGGQRHDDWRNDKGSREDSMKKSALAAAVVMLTAGPAPAEGPDGTIRIGVMNDMSSVYSDFQGPGSVIAAQLAVEDFGGKAAGRKLEVVFADHQNKPDVGAAI